MKGKYRIIVENKRIKYDFEIKRNITVIKGDSATGKTTLIDMISEYEQDGDDSGIQLKCKKDCRVLSGKRWKTILDTIHESIIFIDEGNSFISSKEFANAVKKSDNYFVLVTRESLSVLPYSVEEIYGIRNSGKYGKLKRTYNEMYRIYSDFNPKEEISPEVVITEDSKSGYQFFENITRKSHIKCISANGKSNIYDRLCENKGKKLLIIADGAAFGPEMEKVMSFIKKESDCNLYLPESFEWLILKSGIIKITNISDILENTWNYIESTEYISWERYFTMLLVENTKDTYLSYNKSELNVAYVDGSIRKSILEQMKQIKLLDLEKRENP